MTNCFANDEDLGLGQFQNCMGFVSVSVPPNRPLLPVQSGQVSVILNKPTNVTCRADSGKPKSDITWKKDDIRVTEHIYETVTQQPNSKLVDTTGIITLTAQLEDAGKKIECGAWNEALNGSEPYWTQATLNVQCRYLIEEEMLSPNLNMPPPPSPQTQFWGGT